MLLVVVVAEFVLSKSCSWIRLYSPFSLFLYLITSWTVQFISLGAPSYECCSSFKIDWSMSGYCCLPTNPWVSFFLLETLSDWPWPFLLRPGNSCFASASTIEIVKQLDNKKKDRAHVLNQKKFWYIYYVMGLLPVNVHKPRWKDCI